jgi:hypothetical protein
MAIYRGSHFVGGGVNYSLFVTSSRIWVVPYTGRYKIMACGGGASGTGGITSADVAPLAKSNPGGDTIIANLRFEGADAPNGTITFDNQAGGKGQDSFFAEGGLGGNYVNPQATDGVLGSGGGGVGSTTSASNGGRGGSAASMKFRLLTLSKGQEINIEIGAGGDHPIITITTPPIKVTSAGRGGDGCAFIEYIGE